MFASTVQRINATPELLAVAVAARRFRSVHRDVTGRGFAEGWTRRLGRIAEADEAKFKRLVPLAGAVASAAVIPPLDELLEAQSSARRAGHSDRWIRKALKHPVSKP